MPDPRPDHRRAQSARAAGNSVGATTDTTNFQRIASWVLIVLIVLTVLGFVGALLYSGFHETNAFFASSFWQIAYILPLVCLPLAAITLISIVVSAVRQKSRQRR